MPASENSKIAAGGYNTSNVYGHRHAPYYQNVIRCLRGAIEPDTDGREGLRSLEILLAS